MNTHARVLAMGLLLAMTGTAAAQVRVTVRAQSIYESYRFDPGFTVDRVSEIATPVGVDLSFGRRLDLSISTGYVALRSDPDETYDRVSGPLDTELRLGLHLVPGRLIAVFTGVAPTGVKVDSAQGAVLTPIASEVIGFAIPTLGRGGAVGAGLVGATAIGRFAVGLGATYSHALPYQPFANSIAELAPGAEVRARLGIEGPLARTTYLRLAGVLAARARDEFGGVVQSGVGQRYAAYAEVVQRFGRTQLTVYGFDVYRDAPAIEGPAVLPRGNLIAAGLRYAIAPTRSLSITPRAEWRISTAAPVTSTTDDGTPATFGALRKAGNALRVGLDVRQAIGGAVSLSLFGSGLWGDVRPTGGEDVAVSGWRGGLILNLTP